MKKKILIIIAMCFFTFGCSKKDAGLIGRFKLQDNNEKYAFVFNEDGGGYFEAGSSKLSFTYSYDENIIKIMPAGQVDYTEYTYHLDGDNLVIDKSFAKEGTYIRN